ncbi:uncharacterized protein LOC111536915 [Piliocolobus tephrosceles]|uniref:uncharacterized protein LOC111536915 n=1 Tax=Piliocolobus tephrosceles TaxID=591936 RepID=UPI000C2ACE3A|nr:uncharacterized protein LOC111536915 [Piliocolobus tephrosceles]
MVRPGLARMSLPRCWFRFPGWAGAEARRGRAIISRRLPSLSPWDAGERHGGLVRLCASLGPLTQHKKLPAGFPQCPHLCLAADPPPGPAAPPGEVLRSAGKRQETADRQAATATAPLPPGNSRFGSRERAPPLFFCPASAPVGRGSRMLPPSAL